MNKKIVILRTKRGSRYTHFIEKEINLRGILCASVRWPEVLVFLKKNPSLPQEALIHPRVASPGKVYRLLKGLEKRGYRCINNSYSVYHTSDKFNSCQLALKNNLPCPLSLRIEKKRARELVLEKVKEWGRVVVKPTQSMEQGLYCLRFDKSNLDEIAQKISQIPREEFVVQEFVDYQRLYRVIVIGSEAMKEAVFYDEPCGGWKASVCLNPSIKVERQPAKELLKLAEKIAQVFKSEIGFIDIFQTKEGLVLNEINTACNLAIHERKSDVNISKKIAAYLISRF